MKTACRVRASAKQRKCYRYGLMDVDQKSAATSLLLTIIQGGKPRNASRLWFICELLFLAVVHVGPQLTPCINYTVTSPQLFQNSFKCMLLNFKHSEMFSVLCLTYSRVALLLNMSHLLVCLIFHSAISKSWAYFFGATNQ